MADFSVSTILKGRDQLSKAFNSSSRAAVLFGEKSSKAFRKASRSGRDFKSVFKGILAAGAVQKGLGLLTSGIRQSTVAFLDFDQAITSASSKFADLDLATKKGQKTLLELKKTARDVGAATEFSAAQSAQAINFLAKAGFNAKQSIALLPGVVDLATGAEVDLARASDIASDAIGAFGLMSKDSGVLASNFTRVMDNLALTSGRTNTSVEQLFEAIVAGAPDFIAAGQKMETFNAIMGKLAGQGRKGEKAGTSIRNIMIRLAAPVPRAAKALNKLGIEVKNSNGGFRDALDILADYEKATKTMGSVQKTATTDLIFGKRAIGAINTILDVGVKSIREFRTELENSTGASKKMAEIMRTSLWNQLKALGSAATELAFKFFTAFQKDGVASIKSMTQAIREFDPKPIIDGLKTAQSIISTTFQMATALLPVLKPLAAFWVTYKTVIIAAAIATKFLTATAWAFAAFQKAQVFILLASHIGFASAGMAVLNAVMTANPIGLIIAGVVALGAAVFVVIKYWDEIIAGLKKAVDIAGQFLGFGGGGTVEVVAKKEGGQAPNAHRTAPNKEEAEARQQQVGFTGQLNIAGAPQGSTFDFTGSGPPKIRVDMMGSN